MLGVRPRPLGAALRTGRDHRCTHTPSIPPPPPCALLHRSFFGLPHAPLIVARAPFATSTPFRVFKAPLTASFPLILAAPTVQSLARLAWDGAS